MKGWGRMKKGTTKTTPAPSLPEVANNLATSRRIVVSPKAATSPEPVVNPSSERNTSFEELYQRHSREVWALAYARWMNADTALDITQEAYLRLWRKWEDGEPILNPRAWLLRVARNLAEDHAKSAFRRNGTHPPQTMDGVQAPGPLPLESLERAETFAQLRAGLEELAEADREI